uniref:Uncharacterized protein n=1 Tax=Lotus japonicus TaxID=34305 RepID=I3SAU6_LOTJA|nr:unknown [Lotus japonicus]
MFSVNPWFVILIFLDTHLVSIKLSCLVTNFETGLCMRNMILLIHVRYGLMLDAHKLFDDIP